nr:CUAEP/CCAEP-tail radical SAM protein [Rhodoferax sp.]
MFKVILVNPYELGRQPFALAQPAAWLKREGFDVHCLDLSLQKLEPAVLADAGLVAIYVGMHTATRIALEAIPRIRQIAPGAHLCVYGLYAPMNEALLRSPNVGVGTVLGGEFEPGILSLAQRLRENQASFTLPNQPCQLEPVVNLEKIEFLTPDRSGLPPLAGYAHLQLPGGGKKTVAFAEGSRGCKHLCRHCPVVPVYQGKFRIVPVEVVMADIRQQAAQGASHISFGDPDFFNGPTHARKLAQALHTEFPEITFDATIKVQHLIEHADLLSELKRCGCLFITSAVEAVDDTILQYLAKNHSSRDFDRAARLLQQAGIGFAPTFVAFTPWTTLEGYRDLLQRLLDLGLAENVPPIQLCIRLLIPEGSYLLQLPGFRELIEDFDATTLGYPWQHHDARVDQLQQQAQSYAAQAEAQGLSRREIFEHIWNLTHAALGQPAPLLPASGFGAPIARMSEPWYCCAEPTTQQLQSF